MQAGYRDYYIPDVYELKAVNRDQTKFNIQVHGYIAQRTSKIYWMYEGCLPISILGIGYRELFENDITPELEKKYNKIIRDQLKEEIDYLEENKEGPKYANSKAKFRNSHSNI